MLMARCVPRAAQRAVFLVRKSDTSSRSTLSPPKKGIPQLGVFDTVIEYIVRKPAYHGDVIEDMSHVGSVRSGLIQVGLPEDGEQRVASRPIRAKPVSTRGAAMLHSIDRWPN